MRWTRSSLVALFRIQKPNRLVALSHSLKEAESDYETCCLDHCSLCSICCSASSAASGNVHRDNRPYHLRELRHVPSSGRSCALLADHLRGCPEAGSDDCGRNKIAIHAAMACRRGIWRIQG